MNLTIIIMIWLPWWTAGQLVTAHNIQVLSFVSTGGCTQCADSRHMRIMPAEKLAEFGTFSGTFHACLVCG